MSADIRLPVVGTGDSGLVTRTARRALPVFTGRCLQAGVYRSVFLDRCLQAGVFRSVFSGGCCQIENAPHPGDLDKRPGQADCGLGGSGAPVPRRSWPEGPCASGPGTWPKRKTRSTLKNRRGPMLESAEALPCRNRPDAARDRLRTARPSASQPTHATALSPRHLRM